MLNNFRFLVSVAATEAKKRKTTDSLEAKSSAKKKSDRKEGFDRGLVPERIIGATDTSGKIAGVFYVATMIIFSFHRRTHVPDEMERHRRSRSRSSQAGQHQVSPDRDSVLRRAIDMAFQHN